jgi:hypothetical protein
MQCSSPLQDDEAKIRLWLFCYDKKEAPRSEMTGAQVRHYAASNSSVCAELLVALFAQTCRAASGSWLKGIAFSSSALTS